MFRKPTTAPWAAQEPTHHSHGSVVGPWIEPYRTQAVHPDVTVPLYQAMISAFLCSIPAVAALWGVARLLHLPKQIGFLWLPAPQPEAFACLFLLVFMPATWRFWSQNLSFARRTLWVQYIEQLAQRDLNHDGIVGHPLRVNGAAAETLAQKARREFEQFVLDCYAGGTTYAALRGQGWRDPAIDRYATWALENGIGKLKGKTNRSGWELVVSEAEALKIVGGLEWLGKR